MTDLLQYTFFQYALMGVVLASVACAVMGVYVVARRMVLLAGGVTHASFGGLGLGVYAGWNPVVTAALCAAAAALGVELLSERRGVRTDTVIGVVWALGMALGTLLLFATPDYTGDLSAFLFGNILTLRAADLWALGGFLLVTCTAVAVFYRAVVAAAFDTEFALTVGLPARAINTAMTLVVSVGVVLCIRVTGIMLLLSLLTLPPMIAERFTRRLAPMMALSAAVSLCCSVAGLALSAWQGVPASAAMVLALVVAYAIIVVATRLRRT